MVTLEENCEEVLRILYIEIFFVYESTLLCVQRAHVFLNVCVCGGVGEGRKEEYRYKFL